MDLRHLMHSRLRRGVGAPGPAAPEDPVALSGTLGSKAKLRTAMRLLSAAGGLLLLAACEGPGGTSDYRAFAPIPKETLDLMAGDGTTKSAPVLIRTYKKEAELELWKQAKDGRYVKLKTFPMCRWSGQLGPKVRAGDRQVPEGFYSIRPGQMVPNSAYYLSFNIGSPNAYDRAWGRTGDAIMVHGACSSAGCLSMTDEQVGEIYAIVREAFAGGQREIQMQSLPFHMTAENLAKHRLDPNIAFWQQLKHGADHFDVTGKEPPVSVCGKGYSFALPSAGGRLDPAAPCPVLDEDAAIEAAVKTKESRDLAEVTALVAKGVQPITLVYRDGGQNAAFAARVAEVSRPDALLGAPEEVPVAAGAPRVPGAMPKATLRPAP